MIVNHVYAKAFFYLFFLASNLYSQNLSFSKFYEINNEIIETNDSIKIVLEYEFSQPIRSRQFENMRSKSRLHAINYISAKKYINEYYKTHSTVKYPHLFLDAIAIIKPYEVEIRAVNFKRISFIKKHSTLEASYAVSKDDFSIIKAPDPSLHKLSIKQILYSAIEINTTNKEFILWLLDIEDDFQNRQQLQNQLKPLMALKANTPIEKDSFNQIYLNEILVNSVMGDISDVSKNNYVKSGIKVAKKFSKMKFYSYSNIMISELLKYDFKRNHLLKMYMDNLNRTSDLEWARMIAFTQKNSAYNNAQYNTDSLLIVDLIFNSLGLLNLENEQFDNDYKDYYNRGLTYFSKEMIDSALTYFLYSLESESINADVLNFIGACYRVKGKPKKALPFLVQCLMLDPFHDYGWGNTALCLNELNYNMLNSELYFKKMASGTNWSKKIIEEIY